MIKVGIVGAAGYTAGELLRILVNHPEASIKYVQSTSNFGNKVYDVHKDLFGDCDLEFSKDIDIDVDVMFLCSGHGKSREFLDKFEIPRNIKIIDLGNDFRLNADAKYNGREFLYALPEMNNDEIKLANNIANPGCFATCIQLALLPLAKNQLLKNEIHISATTGSTGAGQRPTGTTHFSWRNNNFSSYKMFTHQHLGEIGESLKSLQSDFDYEINFVPYRGNFSRGILATVYTETDKSEQELKDLFKEYYKDASFTFVSDSPIDIKQVVNTNKSIMFVEKHGNKVVVTSIIDNLLKGASGQAVENMNIMFGIDPKAGLKLKTVAF
jgi:N-acetyl-gamma-glutamyl-phosphate reductase